MTRASCELGMTVPLPAASAPALCVVFAGDGVGPDSTDEELRQVAPDHPVFRLD
jgi:hypothetical protein